MKNIFRSERTARDGELSFGEQNNLSLSATTWNFQATGALRTGAGTSTFHPFRKIGQSFFDVEAKRHELIDGAVFGVIGVLSIWPIISAAQALVTFIK